jgi:hypothetical protein
MTYSRLRIYPAYQGDFHVDPDLLQVPDFDFDTPATDLSATGCYATVP